MLGGVEAAIATVVLFLGYLYLKANPITPAGADGPAGQRRQRRPAVREPGFVGALKYFFGPLPEGPAFVPGEDTDDQPQPLQQAPPSSSGGRAVQQATTPQPKKQPAVPAVETAADKVRSAAARDAAARRAMERAAALQPPE